MQQAEQDGQDARPLVRPVHAVEPVHRSLQPFRPHRQQHDQRHQGEGGDAAEQDALLAQDPDIQGRRRVERQGQAEGPEYQQQNDPQQFHDNSPGGHQ
ncbi:hypothetical protein D9M68_913630 [compost metagenome]